MAGPETVGRARPVAAQPRSRVKATRDPARHGGERDATQRRPASRRWHHRIRTTDGQTTVTTADPRLVSSPVATLRPMHSVICVAATLPEWLTAIGGLLVFAATAALAWVAKKQMGDARRASAAEAAAIEKQIGASIQQGDAIREAARAQLQPVVFAHGDQLHRGPDDEYDLPEGMIGFGYRLANEGTGLALNVRHGIEIDGRKVLIFEEGISRSLRSGEWQPPPDRHDERSIPRIRPLVVACSVHELPEGWEMLTRYYWATFENVFGERFLTRNPSDPARPAEFRRNEGEVLPAT